MTTFEFTKSLELTSAGDCIIGVSSNFDLNELKRFLKFSEVEIKILIGSEKEIIVAKPNPDFDDSHEMVIRLGSFASSRTFAIDANKASKHINRKLIELLKNPEAMAEVEIIGR